MSETEQQRLDYTRIAPDGIGPMRKLEHYLNAESGLEPALLELVRLRVSLMNGCAFCIGLHTYELRRRNEPEDRIREVASWEATEAYTQRERVALRWAEILTHIQGDVPSVEFQAAREQFSDKELVDLSLAIASINAWNRLGVAFLPRWDESRPTRGRTSGAEKDAREESPPQAPPNPQDAVTAERPEDDGGKVAQDETEA